MLIDLIAISGVPKLTYEACFFARYSTLTKEFVCSDEAFVRTGGGRTE